MNRSTGYLRRDDDGHWFLIPCHRVDQFDALLEEYNDVDWTDPFCDKIEQEILSEINSYWEYRVNGPYDVECLMPEEDDE